MTLLASDTLPRAMTCHQERVSFQINVVIRLYAVQVIVNYLLKNVVKLLRVFSSLVLFSIQDKICKV